MNNKYQLHTFVSFSDHKSRTRIPLSGCTFLIPAPVIEDRPGGPGLDDIRHLLDSADRDESFEFAVASEANSMRVIGAHITRSGMLFIVPSNFLFYQREKNHREKFLHISQVPRDCAKQTSGERLLKMGWLLQTGTYGGTKEYRYLAIHVV